MERRSSAPRDNSQELYDGPTVFDRLYQDAQGRWERDELGECSRGESWRTSRVVIDSQQPKLRAQTAATSFSVAIPRMNVNGSPQTMPRLKDSARTTEKESVFDRLYRNESHHTFQRDIFAQSFPLEASNRLAVVERRASYQPPPEARPKTRGSGLSRRLTSTLKPAQAAHESSSDPCPPKNSVFERLYRGERRPRAELMIPNSMTTGNSCSRPTRQARDDEDDSDDFEEWIRSLSPTSSEEERL